MLCCTVVCAVAVGRVLCCTPKAERDARTEQKEEGGDIEKKILSNPLAGMLMQICIAGEKGAVWDRTELERKEKRKKGESVDI